VVNLQSYLRSLTYNAGNITSLADFARVHSVLRRDTGLWDQALQNWNDTNPSFWPAYQQNLYYGGDRRLLGAIERRDLEAKSTEAKLIGMAYAFERRTKFTGKVQP
jgi:amidase